MLHTAYTCYFSYCNSFGRIFANPKQFGNFLLFSQNSVKYYGQYQLQKKKSKNLKYFDFTLSRGKSIIQQARLWCS